MPSSRSIRNIAISVALLLAAVGNIAAADTENDPPASITKGVAHVGSAAIPYHAVAAHFPLLAEDAVDGRRADELWAKVFYVAYTRDNCDPKRRFITFCFNGGPGVASSGLHFTLGPQCFASSKTGGADAYYPLINNSSTLLDLTDLVFVDPIPTGYSHAASDVPDSEFEGYSNDVTANSQFVEQYLRSTHRENSPKILLGESYGSIRIAGMADILPKNYHVEVDGLVLMSQALNSRANAGFSRSVQELPTCAAIAWHQRTIDARWRDHSLEATCVAAEAFDRDEYAPLLTSSFNPLTAKSREVASRLAEFTGIPTEDILTNNLQLQMKELAIDGRGFNGFDARKTYDKDHETDDVRNIFSSQQTSIDRAFAYNYGFQAGIPYRQLAPTPWSWRGSLTSLNALGDNLTLNPHARIFMAAGRYDLIVPYYCMLSGLADAHLEPSMLSRIETHVYPSGHMVCSDPESLVKFKQDFSRWLDEIRGGT